MLMARDLRPILRISSAVLLECTQPCETATCASTLPAASAVFCRSGSSSTRMSVTTTSAPCLASVSASWRPRPREAPVTMATFPERSNNLLPPQFDGPALARQRAGDDEPLDFRRAFPDLIDLRVAEPLLDRILLDIAVAAEHLDGVCGDLHRSVRREALRHGTFRAIKCPVLRRHPAGAPDEQASGVDLHRHVGELEADGFVLPQGLAELLALLRVLQGKFLCSACDALRTGPHSRTGRLERHHGTKRSRTSVVSVRLTTETVVEWDMAVLEDDLRGVTRPHTQLLLLATHAKPGRVLR